ncbi:MAG: c-type cytochrome [Gemmatales bacterium]|nr:c-type cytochrome [Gemmatales bacterium]MDW8387508.1 c-type cytochrome [Gemmatales bacterium]
MHRRLVLFPASSILFSLGLGSILLLAVPNNHRADDRKPPPQTAAPRAAHPGIVVELFAQAPDIVHPVAITLDSRGRLLVIESHTHFRPKGYQGPERDRIRILEDTDGDGKADRFTTFYEGVVAAMDLACHPDGSIYLATRNEVLRLVDHDHDGKADTAQRLVFLDTMGDYPHNGLCGLTFDHRGHLYFGMGENLGVRYCLRGSDGTTICDEGEGGNVFWCTADGKNLRRVATGFWNPFGMCYDRHGRLWAVDNDPDAMPPCRLLHVVEGGDYGYQFRYGRSGRHVFQCWNGQLPGTLPMVCGVGEGPCEVIRYEGAGLPGGLHGDLLVTAWADHRIERYRLIPHGASYRAERLPFVQGGPDFRPVGLVQARDGSLFVSDWVLANYELHGKGAVWRIRSVQPAAERPQASATEEKPENRLAPVYDLPGEGAWERLRPLLMDDDPFLRHAATWRLSRHRDLLEKLLSNPPESAVLRRQLLLAQRLAGPSDPAAAAARWLRDDDAEIRFLALKWIADQNLKSCRAEVEKLLADSTLSLRLFQAAATAWMRIEGQGVHESRMAEFYLAKALDAASPPAVRAAALRLVPTTHKGLTVALLEQLITSPDAELSLEAVRSLRDHPDPKRFDLLGRLAERKDIGLAIRLEAVAGLSGQGQAAQGRLLALAASDAELIRAEALRGLTGLQIPQGNREAIEAVARNGGPLSALADRVLGKPFAINRPPKTDLDAWLQLLDGPGDAEAGRRVFFHPRLAGCFKCHRVDGRGGEIGPDLSGIGQMERPRLVQALVQPDADIAPAYVPWVLVTANGQTRTGLLVRTYLDEYTYADEKGDLFTLKTHDVAESKPARRSLMPDGLVDQLTLQELRDLLAFLQSRR